MFLDEFMDSYKKPIIEAIKKHYPVSDTDIAMGDEHGYIDFYLTDHIVPLTVIFEFKRNYDSNVMLHTDLESLEIITSTFSDDHSSYFDSDLENGYFES